MDEIGVAVAGGAVKTGGFFLSPLGKWNLIIAGIFLSIMIVSGIFQSVEQRSLFPLLDNTVFRVTAADTKIGQAVDDMESQPRPEKGDSILSKQFPSWLWFWLKFWFLIIGNLFFIYFFIFLLYGIFYTMNSSLIARNIILALVAFIIISLVAGMMLYNTRLAGLCLPSDKMQNFESQMRDSYPLHGTIKLVGHFATKDLFYKVASWNDQNGFVAALTNIPTTNQTSQTINISVDNTGG